MSKSERSILFAVSLIALLMFFFPIASIQLPIVGDMQASGYEIFTRSDQFANRIDGLNANASSNQEESAMQESLHANPLPASFKTIAYLPYEIYACFFLMVILFLLSIFDDSRMNFKIFSTIAAVLSIGTNLHIVILDSDIHTWLQNNIANSMKDLDGNPFAGLAQGVGTLIVNSIHFRPGYGLYIFALCASLAAILLHGDFFKSVSISTPAQISTRSTQPNFDIRNVIVISVMLVALCSLMIIVKINFDNKKQFTNHESAPVPTTTVPQNQMVMPTNQQSDKLDNTHQNALKEESPYAQNQTIEKSESGTITDSQTTETPHLTEEQAVKVAELNTQLNKNHQQFDELNARWSQVKGNLNRAGYQLRPDVENALRASSNDIKRCDALSTSINVDDFEQCVQNLTDELRKLKDM